MSIPATPIPIATEINPPLEVARTASPRLASLDVFRGIVILTMLLVNNMGDYRVIGYFWKHADWEPVSLGSDFIEWFKTPTFASFPLFMHCRLADYVMPMFMLIIGMALPFAAASARKRGNTGPRYWLGVLRRGMTLYALGWAISLSLTFLNWRFSSNPNAKLSFTLGMDVLQLLGTAYVVSRVLFELPPKWRLLAAAGLFVWHWSFLRFWPQGDIPAGTFTEEHNAVAYAYRNWWIFSAFSLTSWLKFSIAGMLSVPCAAGTMLLGSFVGQILQRDEISPTQKIKQLSIFGLILIGIGLLWAFDLPMNKPRWTPCYLVYTAGIGTLIMAATYLAVDVRRWIGGAWIWPLTALGVNAIGIYFISIMAKIWCLNMVKVTLPNGTTRGLTSHIIDTLQKTTTPQLGSWIFTLTFVGLVWSVAMVAHYKKIIWKV